MVGGVRAYWAIWGGSIMCRLLFANIKKITHDNFINALSLMERGGPDAPLCYQAINGCQLGHNRLSILGLDARCNQPFYSKDKRYCIVYNGEVYNYKELAVQYGITLETNCDTELVLALGVKIGFAKALQQFNGMFAFVVLDTKTGSIFAARDRLGIKPLYVHECPDGVIFSSEINAIVDLLGGNVSIDDTGLRQYKKLRIFFNGHTIYNEIKMLAAGSYMTLDDERGGRGEVHKWWELPHGEQCPPQDEELRALVEDAVRIRKVSDVPLGSYLSGGLDSTIVASLTHETHTWTVGFEDCNEFEWGRLAARRIKSCHHEVVIDRDSFMKDAAFMARHRKEPLSVPNEVLLYEMTRKVKEHNTVVLCGEGADELFFGYDRIFRWAAGANAFDVREFAKYYAYSNVDDTEIVEDALSPFMDYGKPIDIVAAFFQVAHLHGLLRRLDNSTMMCAVEARVPFVDHRLVERMAGVPFDYRMKDGVVKSPLKRVFADIVPQEIIERKKVGFPVRLDVLFGVEKSKAFDAWTSFNLEKIAG